jgi:hypothetical protein
MNESKSKNLIERQADEVPENRSQESEVDSILIKIQSELWENRDQWN